MSVCVCESVGEGVRRERQEGDEMGGGVTLLLDTQSWHKIRFACILFLRGRVRKCQDFRWRDQTLFVFQNPCFALGQMFLIL